MNRGIRLLAVAAICLQTASPGFAVARDNPFADVPRGHWAYAAVRDAVRAGILEGYNGRFHGAKAMTRYQMAQVVQRLMHRMGGKRPGDWHGKGSVTDQDLRNLEALTIEFADELALLNVKVSTLEDNVAGLKHDVEALKGGYPGHHKRKMDQKAGLSGLVSIRVVATGDGGPVTGNGPATAGTPATGVPRGMTRYRGSAVTGAGGVTKFESRTFLTIPQLSIAFDREIDEGIRLHTQMDFDADFSTQINPTGVGGAAGPAGAATVAGGGVAAALPSGDGNLQINEAWIEAEDVIAGWGLKLGGYALPFSDEHNGRFRTLDWTISPTAQTSRYERYRPIGAEFISNDSIFGLDIRAGLFTGLDNQNASLFTNEFFLANGAGFGPSTITPLSDITYGIGPIGLTGPSEAKDFGFYARVADHSNDGGLGWDINYMTNGDINAPGALGVRPTDQEFEFVSGTVDYYWDWFAIVAQFYSGKSKNVAAPVAGTTGTGIFATTADTDSTAFYVMANYRVNPDNNITVRYEAAEDETAGVNRFRVDTITAAWNRIISDHSLLQIEFMTPDSTFTNLATSTTVGGDTADEILQANYKLLF